MKQITEDYCSFEIAQLLKEKGFDEKCSMCYAYFADDDIRVLNLKVPKHAQSLIKDRYPYITHQMALKWLREEYTICIEVCRNINTFYYSYRVIQGASFVKLLDWTDCYDKYEQAVEAALKYTLENLI